MSDDWRGAGGETERPIDAWFRHRYAKDTVYVLNIDKVICHPSLRVGGLLELKHVDARDKSWRATRRLALGNGWWAGLIEHDGEEPRFVTLLPPDAPLIPRQPFSAAWFDAWVCDSFGARLRA